MFTTTKTGPSNSNLTSCSKDDQLLQHNKSGRSSEEPRGFYTKVNMLAKLVIVAIVAILVALYLAQPKVGLKIETKYGAIQGIISTSRDGREFYEWRGIPYAKPPVGTSRFDNPKRFGKWEGIRDGSKFGAKCAQAGVFTSLIEGDEDCLYLNINKPKISSSSEPLMPVMVFIHGGAFQEGSGDMYEPKYFMDEDVILVSLNYRLGPFGFLNTGDSGIRGNMGLKDQAMALRWVKENIQSFGGNPNMITIFGESAGGASVEYLMLSPLTKGLFSKGISQSGSSYAPWAYDTVQVARNFTLKFAQYFDCAFQDSTLLRKCLEGKSVRELLAKYHEMESRKSCYFYILESGHWFRPSLEAVNDSEALIVEHPLEILTKGKSHKVPYMLGNNKDDGIFPSLPFYTDEEKLLAYEHSIVHETQTDPQCTGVPRGIKFQVMANAFDKFYFQDNRTEFSVREKALRFTQIFTDMQFNIYASHTSSILREQIPLYLYFFNKTGVQSATPIVEAILRDRFHPLIEIGIYLVVNFFKNLVGVTPPDYYGVGHGDDITYQFSVPWYLMKIPKDDTSLDYRFSRDMVKLWSSFARDEYNSTLEFRGVKWNPQEGTGSKQYLELSETPQIIDEPFGERVQFLNSFDIIPGWRSESP